MALTTKQEKAVALLVEGKLKKQEIAALLKVSPQSMSKWQKLPEFEARLKEMSMKMLRGMAPKLLKNQLSLAFNARSEMVRYNATTDLLNRLGMAEDQEESEKDSRVEDIINAYAAVTLASANTHVDRQAGEGPADVSD